MISLAAELLSIQPKRPPVLYLVPGPATPGYGHGPKRSTLLRLIPTKVEPETSPQSPGEAPSKPPAVTSAALSRFIAKRAFLIENQFGRSQMPRLRLRVAVMPSKVVTTETLASWPPTVGSS